MANVWMDELSVCFARSVIAASSQLSFLLFAHPHCSRVLPYRASKRRSVWIVACILCVVLRDLRLVLRCVALRHFGSGGYR